MPITLDVTKEFSDQVKPGDAIALRDKEGVVIATMVIEDQWTPDKPAEAKAAFGTDSEAHPTVDYLMNQANEVYLGGALKGIEPPPALRFQTDAGYSFGVTRSVPQTGLAQSSGLSDQKPYAQGPPGTDLSSGQGKRGQSTDPTGSGNDQTRRYRSL